MKIRFTGFCRYKVRGKYLNLESKQSEGILYTTKANLLVNRILNVIKQTN